MENKVLICGHRSFVATGLAERFIENGINCDCFSRGIPNRNGNIVTGDVVCMAENNFLSDYDTVINFIILKDKDIVSNIDYIKSLLCFCEKCGAKHLIQISSISVYANDASYVNEDSPIEQIQQNKGGYAGIKIEVDRYLENNCPKGISLSFVRPGFVYDKDHIASKSGILFSILGMPILFGDKKTSLPLIRRDRVHKALIKIVSSSLKERVFLLLNSDKTEGSKYNFVKNEWDIKPIVLPGWAMLPLSRWLWRLGILKERHYMRVAGLFKRTWFDSRKTEAVLGFSFGKSKIAVVGAGTYGSYTATLLSRIYPHEEIFLYDVGNKHLKTEKEIGYLSHISNAPYEGLQKARFFGFGGASAKWGGQLLTFSDSDFSSPNKYLTGIVLLNKKWKDTVLSRFGLSNKAIDVKLDDHLFCKTGIWLSYFHRNLFKYFRVAENSKIKIISDCRITKFLHKDTHVTGFEYINNGKLQIASYDHYFLTTGAFESCRILLNSGMVENNYMTFSDHLSQRAFKVMGSPKMGKEDFTFRMQGASLITKRFVGEIDGYSFYSQPINNEEFPFFKDLKSLLFGHRFSAKLIGNIFRNIPECIALVWCMLVLKKLYVYKNEFYLQIDIEAPQESGIVSLRNERDEYGEKSIDVNLSILPQTGELFTRARDYIKAYLDANGVKYEELPFSTTAEKYEDVYHPFGMFCNFKDVDDFFYHFDNMLVVNTGVLPRAGGINSTCAVLPLVEEYLNSKMKFV